MTIDVELAPKIDRERMNAFTQIHMVTGLVRAATTRLRVWKPEYLAHEIEHVLEQVDGVDLHRSARGGLEGVQETQSSVFETARAIAIGRVVAREVAQGVSTDETGASRDHVRCFADGPGHIRG